MYNKDDLLDSYFMANDYKETDIEIATKNINDFIEKYGNIDIKSLCDTCKGASFKGFQSSP